MGIIELGLKLSKNKKSIINIFSKESSFEEISSKLLSFLEELSVIETSLWGVNITRIKNDEDKIIEDSNHLVYLVSKKSDEDLFEILKNKDVKIFSEDLISLKDDFKKLKKKVHDRNNLKNLITNFSIKLVDKNHFQDLENIFILEKQLYGVLELQEIEFDKILTKSRDLKLDLAEDFKRIEFFLNSLKEIRNILGGHLEFHELWEEERFGYSNTSNIIHSLINSVKNLIEKNK